MKPTHRATERLNKGVHVKFLGSPKCLINIGQCCYYRVVSAY